MAGAAQQSPPPLTPPLPPQEVVQPPSRPAISLQNPTRRKSPSKPIKIVRRLRSTLRSLPITTFTSYCRVPVSLNQTRSCDGHIPGATRMTGTVFGNKKARVNLAIQENPRSLPILLLELAITTEKLLHDMGTGLARIVFECEKSPGKNAKNTMIIDEPIWAMYRNGKKSGYAVKREATDDDLEVMQMLHAVSVGAGVLPGGSGYRTEGDLTYMRSNFERVAGSRDSETYYMVSPGEKDGPDLSIFFIRI